MDHTCSLMAVLQSSRTMPFTPEHPTLMRSFGWTRYQGSQSSCSPVCCSAAHIDAAVMLHDQPAAGPSLTDPAATLLPGKARSVWAVWLLAVQGPVLQ